MIMQQNEVIAARLIGYARVTTKGQDNDATSQVDALLAAGCPKNLIFKDVASGPRAKQPGLDKCLSTLCKGDTLIVQRLDRLGRALPYLVKMVTELRELGIEFRSLTEDLIDTTTATGDLVSELFCVLAQFELRLVEEQARADLEATRARGRKGGRKPISLNDAKVQAALLLYDKRDLTVPEICKVQGISKTTLYRWKNLRDEDYQSA